MTGTGGRKVNKKVETGSFEIFLRLLRMRSHELISSCSARVRAIINKTDDNIFMTAAPDDDDAVHLFTE